MRLRVGVIGLGRRWRRYRPILMKLRDHVEVRAVHDQIVRRAESEARRLHCTATMGPVELLDRPDVEAVLLCDDQWFGLWPLEHLCRTNKPVFCALSPADDDAHADALRQRIQESGLPVFMALGPLLTPATRFLRQLLTHRLGAARLVRADWSMPLARDLLNSPAVLPLLAGCAWLLDDRPRSVWTIDGEDASFVTLVLRFGGERLVQVTLWTATAGRTPGRFEVVAESGTATAELPRHLRWRDADGQHGQRLPPRSAEQSGLEHFILALRAGQPLRPSFEDAYQALTWLRAAVRSRTEGRRIELPDT
ncbi:MAG TPA: Gfo/Idh/MocA family oxidoreductase [Gemmataceae bacterium]|jgi:predicted dehydrogenase